MPITKEEMLALPRKYESVYENGREREVAIYIDGEYASRGPASHARQTCQYGFASWNGIIPPSRITWELDSFWGKRGERDETYLCWDSGIRLTSEEMLGWLNATR